MRLYPGCPAIIVIATIILMTGCSEGTDKKIAGDHRQAPPDSSRPAGQSQPDQAQDRAIRKLDFDTRAVAKGYPHQGKITGGARWIDGNGENTLIVSEEFTRSKEMEDETIQQIFGYLYTGPAGASKLLWKIQDMAENYCDRGDGLVSEVAIADVNADGVAENAFVYNIQGRCDVSPATHKLMLHSGASKYAVRGTTRVFTGSDSVGGEKRFDPSFDGAPEEFRRFASQLWDKYVRERNLP